MFVLSRQSSHLTGFRQQRGLSLLEVLVAIVILTIGLLGVARMQASGLVSTDRAYQRSQATVLAYDIADRMRANPSSFNNYLSDTMEAADATAQSGCVSTSGCTTAQMAENDLYEWNAALQAALPGAVGTVSQAGTLFTVGINWDDNGDGAVDGDDANFQVSFQL